MEAARAPGTIAVANAPVSYGAFEVTVGYLGTGERLGELLAERGLGLAGAYLELPYADPDGLAEVMPALDELLGAFDTVQAYLPGPPPRPTLADAGSRERRSRPFRSTAERSLGLDA